MEDKPDIIYSEYSGDYEIDKERLRVLIHKTDRDLAWTLEVVNSNGTSIVWEDPFVSDGVAFRVFMLTTEEEGIRAFLDEDDPRQTIH